MSYKHPFLEVLSELGEDSEKLVLVGGWVPIVYFQYLWSSEFFMRTNDIDFGVASRTVLDPKFEQHINLNHYKKRHLKIGHLKPYQLLFKDSPVDFLTDEKYEKRVRRHVLGNNVLINTNPGYEYVLEDTITIQCEDVLVRVPHPARYITHKIQVYLNNLQKRQRDIAMAYYCYTKDPVKKAVREYRDQIRQTDVVRAVREGLPGLIQDTRGLAIQDTIKIFRTYGRTEPPVDIRNHLSELVAVL